MDQENSTYDGPVVLRSKIRYEPFSSRLSEKREERDRESDVISLYCPYRAAKRDERTRSKRERAMRFVRVCHTCLRLFSLFLFLSKLDIFQKQLKMGCVLTGVKKQMRKKK